MGKLIGYLLAIGIVVWLFQNFWYVLLPAIVVVFVLSRKRARKRGSQVSSPKISAPAAANYVQSETDQKLSLNELAPNINEHLEHPNVVVRIPVNQPPVIIRDKLEFAVIDFETTGLYIESGDRAIQVAVTVVNSDGRIIETWSSILNPERKVGATHIHGIRDQDVKGAPKFADIRMKLDTLISGRVLVGHNISFDLRVLKMELRRLNLGLAPLGCAVIDTMRLSHLLGEIPDKKMATCAIAAGVLEPSDVNKLHNAEFDTQVTAALLWHYVKTDPEVVWRSVSWPLLSGVSEVLFLSSSQTERHRSGIQAKLDLHAEIVASRPARVVLPKSAGAYLSNVDWESKPTLESRVRESGLTLIPNFTKRDCSVLVVENFDQLTGRMENAFKWGIPILKVDELNLITFSE